MQPITLLKPLLHGAVGFWDEVINLIPLVIGAALLLYMIETVCPSPRASGHLLFDRDDLRGAQIPQRLRLAQAQRLLLRRAPAG